MAFRHFIIRAFKTSWPIWFFFTFHICENRAKYFLFRVWMWNEWSVLEILLKFGKSNAVFSCEISSLILPMLKAHNVFSNMLSVMLHQYQNMKFCAKISTFVISVLLLIFRAKSGQVQCVFVSEWTVQISWL